MLPHGPRDVAVQFLFFALAYAAYELVRGLVAVDGSTPFANATRIIELERSLHVFVEPRVQAWVSGHAHWLLLAADWSYLNAHFALTLGALCFIYLRRNDSFATVRNGFLVAMAIALFGYALYPTAPPRLMPQYGFQDSVRQFTGIDAQRGAGGLLINPYAAIPSMHVCFALLIALPMAALVRHRLARILWRCYPAFIVFVVIVTANHYFTDVLLGILTAALSLRLAPRVELPARAASLRLRRSLGLFSA